MTDYIHHYRLDWYCDWSTCCWSRHSNVRPSKHIHDTATASWITIVIFSTNQADTVLQYLQQHQDDANLPDKRGHMPLMMASAKGHTHIVEILLKYGANPNQGDDDGHTALMFSMHYGHQEAANRLLNAGASLDMLDDFGRTTLQWAEAANRHDMANLVRVGQSLLPHPPHSPYQASRSTFHGMHDQPPFPIAGQPIVYIDYTDIHA